jgi:hypothetical protein
MGPFDISKGLTKLTSWDALPSDAEVENIKQLLARIQEIKNAMGSRLIGTHLMVFFLQRHIQLLQAQLSKLWTYSVSNDPSRVSSQDPKKKDLNKRVRSLTTLTAKNRSSCVSGHYLRHHAPLATGTRHAIQINIALSSLFSF